MLRLPIYQKDVDKVHPDLLDELYSGYAPCIQNNSCSFVLSGSSSTRWLLTDTSQTSFSSSYIGEFGVVVGGWGFEVLDALSTQSIAVEFTEYPVALTIDTDYIGGYSIGGYALQIINAAEEIQAKFQNNLMYPEGFVWDNRTKMQLKKIFVYKTLENIFLDLATGRDEIWWETYNVNKTRFLEAWNSVRARYEPENEPSVTDLEVKQVKINRF